MGGNLSILYSLLGSNSDIDTEGKILLIEDLDEYLYHIDRMIINLKRNGKLAQLNGLIVGGFQTRNKNVGETIDKLRNEWLRIREKGINKKELDNAKAYYKGSFSRNLTSTLSISKLLMTVQYYDLGDNYFLERNNIIDNIKIKDVNKVATNLFFEDQLFFMIVGKPVLKTK
mgnify:CR=1 FL=1